MSTCVTRHDTCHDTKQSLLLQTCRSSIIISVTWSLLYHGAGYITQQFTSLHTSSSHAYFKAQSKWGSADNTAHLSDVTAHRPQTTWQMWWLCTSLFANSNPPALVQTFIYAVFQVFSDIGWYQYCFCYYVMYRGADKSLAQPTTWCILFEGENISFDASLVICINSTNIPPIIIIKRIYEHQNLSL
jgi:hypothetical protein